MENPRISVQREQGVTVVELLDGDIPKYDEQANSEIAQALFATAQQETPVKMVVDFGRVNYVGSAMLGTLIRLSKRIHETGGGLKLCSMPLLLLEMFVITKLDRVFEVHPEKQAAISSFGAG